MFIKPSYAKINLFLYILNRRDDGYHNIYTLYSKISLCDYIILEKSETFNIICNTPQVPTDERNLIYKGYQALVEGYGLKNAYNVYLIKNIPVGSGLGGGSSNVSTFLNMVDSVENLKLSLYEKSRILATLGSDTVFFLYDTAMIGKGKGTELSDLPGIPFFYILLIVPPVSISTTEIYKDSNLKLTPDIAPFETHNFQSVSNLVKCMNNGFEDIVFGIYPVLSEIKENLEYMGALKAMLTGTGSAIFALFSSKSGLDEAYDYMKTNYKDSKIFRVVNI